MPTAKSAPLRIAMAQINPVLGDLEGNSQLILGAVKEALVSGADVVLFSEMVLTGYPVEDLALRPAFQSASRRRVNELAEQIEKIGGGELLIIIGYLDHNEKPENALAAIHRGKVVGKYVKHHLPNYGVFDEFRNFGQGDKSLVIRFGSIDIALAICEDIWQEGGPVANLSKANPGILLVANGSPFERDKDGVRLDLARKRVKQLGCPLVYLNMVGAQDDLVFDGGSFALDSNGEVIAKSEQFESLLNIVDIECEIESGSPDLVLSGAIKKDKGAARTLIAPSLSDEEEIWKALVVGLKDYVSKNGFKSVALGLSGGIDSALTATLAVDALGKESVYGLLMPSKYSSTHSISDAKELAENLGIGYEIIEIGSVVSSFQSAIELSGLAEENIQARVRGSLLMGLSNQRGHLILATGNKSELAVGYSTLYGDAVGGFAPIKDIFKVDIWRLARWRNSQAGGKGLIPVNSIEKAPSAELSPGQRDSDSLPDYELLDQVLKLYIEKNIDATKIIASGFDKALVDRVVAMVDKAEYKRRQYPPGPKVSPIAFGKDRRLPMTSRWKES
ncbi:MAG TPA: NAD+ synthase [Candidatus Nanopelagicaceae bacterium]|nr:NAD+ synthase [Candidatus Nanopelagicaceae bacterium]